MQIVLLILPAYIKQTSLCLSHCLPNHRTSSCQQSKVTAMASNYNLVQALKCGIQNEDGTYEEISARIKENLSNFSQARRDGSPRTMVQCQSRNDVLQALRNCSIQRMAYLAGQLATADPTSYSGMSDQDIIRTVVQGIEHPNNAWGMMYQ